MNNDKLIAEIECCFDKNRNGITFNGDSSAKINLIVDGAQLASVAKLLLLVGQEKTFTVIFYDNKNKKTRKLPAKSKHIQTTRLQTLQ